MSDRPNPWAAACLLLLGSIALAGEEEPGGPDPERIRQAGEKIRRMCLPAAVFESTAAGHRPNPFWKRHLVFSLVNHTQPHIPDCRVAISPEDEVLVLAGHGDRVRTSDPVGNFNKVALQEQVKIGPNNLQAYLRFVLECHIASFSPELYEEDAERAKAIRSSEDADRARGMPEVLGVKETAEGWLLVFHYAEWWWDGVVRFEVQVHADGTIAVAEKAL